MELLAVIALLAALFILLLPAAGKVRSRFTEARSIQNLRQMVPPLLAYIEDHGGHLPEGAFSPSVKGVRVKFWYHALEAYNQPKGLAGVDQSKHPAWMSDPLKKFPTPLIYVASDISIGYGWNHGNFGYTASWHPEKMGWKSHINSVQSPSQTIIIGSNTDATGEGDPARNLLIYNNVSLSAKRYRGGGLYLFLDGHVEWLLPEAACATDRNLFLKTKP